MGCATGGTVGALLLSATNPESGTVTYTYNSDQTLATKTDAKGQVFTYSYDTLKRVTTISQGGGTLRTFIYDSNSLDGSFSQYTQGRLAAVQYNGLWADMYSYTHSGHVTKKRTQVKQAAAYASGTAYPTLNLDATYAYDTKGKMTSVGYPLSGPTYTYSFDSMSRPAGLTDQSSNTIVSGLGYGPANEMLSMTYNGATETHSYNNMLQLTTVQDVFETKSRRGKQRT